MRLVTERFPANVDVELTPLTVMNPPNVEVPVVLVATKYGAVTEPVKIPAPVTASGTPGVVEPIPTKSDEVTSVTVVPLSCQPDAACAAPLQMLFPEVQTRWPDSAVMFPVTAMFPANVDVDVTGPPTRRIEPEVVVPVIVRSEPMVEDPVVVMPPPATVILVSLVR